MNHMDATMGATGATPVTTAVTCGDEPEVPTSQTPAKAAGDIRATVLNIQKFSLDDGPGIRTTVFLKGCPLRCAWCANPESQRLLPELEWKAASCVGCRCCVARWDGLSFEGEPGCERLTMARDGRPDDETRAEIERGCPGEAITFVGATRTAAEVVAECEKDRAFYESSGGGVTFSGGEVLLWPDFVVAASGLLHERGIQVAVETTGHGSAEAFEAIADAVDLMLIDVKHWDDDAHRAGTGQGLGLISANLGRAVAGDTEVLCRMPVIPGFNIDDVADPASVETTARAIACHLSACAGERPLPRLQLLPFHQLGESKYELLGRAYDLAHQPSLHHEDLEPLVVALRAQGVDAFL